MPDRDLGTARKALIAAFDVATGEVRGNVFEMLRICKMGVDSGGDGTGASLTVNASLEAAFEGIGRLPGGGAYRLRLADLA